MQLSRNDLIWLIGIVVITFLVLALFFIIVLLINSRNRRMKKIEILNAMLNIQENERKRIAEDLHDDIGPMLSAIKLQINSFTSDSSDRLTADIRQTSSHLDNVIQSIRDIVRNLSPANMNRKGLVASIEDFEKIVGRSGKIQFRFTHSGILVPLGENAEINIYRIVHEMLNNSLKHSNCTEIALSLVMNKDFLQVEYKDNGRLHGKLPSGNGMGLNNITNRVRLLNGTMSKSDNFKEGAFYHITFQNKNITS